MSEQTAIAVGRVPSRADGCITVHIADHFVYLLPEEVRRLIADLSRALPADGAALLNPAAGHRQ
jgi:hypothetical protein